MSGWLVVTRTYLYYFPLSLAHCRFDSVDWPFSLWS